MKHVRESSIKVGTLVVAYDQLAIITEVNPSRPKNKYAFKHKTAHKGYICGLDSIQAILGQGDIEAWNRIATAAPERVPCSEGPALFGPLADVKVGTRIQISGRNGMETVTYQGWSHNRPKYPVSFERNGRPYKGPVSMVKAVERDGKFVPVGT
jgi:hypothetical protein